MVEELQFDVLLDKVQGTEVRDLRLGGGELKAARCYHSGNTGVADSVEAVQSAGLLQVPTYAHAHGRSFECLESPSWSEFHDTLGERLTLRVDKSYDGVSKGDYVVDVQGGGLFMPRHELIRRAILNRELVNNAMPIKSEDKDLLLGSRLVYRWDGRKVQVVPVTHFFTSYKQFSDVSQTEKFEKSLRDLSAVYVVVRPASEARQNPSGRRLIVEQLSNPDLILACGSKARLNKMLMEAPDKEGKQVPRFNWEQFGSWHDGYQNVDTGRVGVLGNDYYDYDVYYGYNVNDCGGSGGVAPEALDTWREAQTRENSGLESRVK